MTDKEEHEHLKKAVKHAGVLGDFETEESPILVVDNLLIHDVKEACAIIDCLNPLIATLVLYILRTRGMEYKDSKAREIYRRADQLGVKGITGLRQILKEFSELPGHFSTLS